MSSKKISGLVKISTEKQIDPVIELDFSVEPDRMSPWMSENLVSLYGTKYWDDLSSEQKRTLSQKEFALYCSIACQGEKEVIANIARLMLKERYEYIREYLYYFIKEENNHIYMFSTFCRKYDKLYPSLYSYVSNKKWKNPLIEDLLTFVHVLIFEELGDIYNKLMESDENLPGLVRQINYIHTHDEKRHVSFGREVVRELTKEVYEQSDQDELVELREHIVSYLNTRHHEYHNVSIYREIGLKDAFYIRNELIEANDCNYFVVDEHSNKKVNSLLNFLKDNNLV
ncbi:hypothetical protein BCT76_18005 [Vibrio tasmaniensis]|uniref:diiron oxygenase n=1 Tax=Vibrio tasmaniensis TaxID=212663 RepID=UPI000C853F7A|nr:diiron oxygenase [Vibrio tasmaniensis]PML45373.1 hypothetical protein BCT76_18005 [Vibrio tasmaniensis]